MALSTFKEMCQNKQSAEASLVFQVYHRNKADLHYFFKSATLATFTALAPCDRFHIRWRLLYLIFGVVSSVVRIEMGRGLGYLWSCHSCKPLCVLYLLVSSAVDHKHRLCEPCMMVFAQRETDRVM